jgi:Uma2 family endonuclease
MVALSPQSDVMVDDGPEPAFVGLRMDAEQFLALPESKHHYELINGVVLVSPSPIFRHQNVILRISQFLLEHCQATNAGEVAHDIDVRFAIDLVYRPDLVFIAQGRASLDDPHIRVAPDLVVEVLSPSTKNKDQTTKFADYERFGVREYWLVDPATRQVRWFALDQGKYVEQPVTQGVLESKVLAGLRLELDRLWA